MAAGDGVADYEIARGWLSATFVRAWLARFAEKALDGFGKVAEGPGPSSPGCPTEPSPRCCASDPRGEPSGHLAHWTARTLGKRFRIDKDSVARI